MLPVGVEPTISTLLVWRLTNLAIEAVYLDVLDILSSCYSVTSNMFFQITQPEMEIFVFHFMILILNTMGIAIINNQKGIYHYTIYAYKIEMAVVRS